MMEENIKRKIQFFKGHSRMRPLKNSLWYHLVASESLNMHNINCAYVHNYDLKYPEKKHFSYIVFKAACEIF